MARSNKLDVVIAVIIDDGKQVLLTQRGKEQSFPLHWEFPGGKVERGESIDDALCREIQEELGVKITKHSFWHQFEYQYPHFTVYFHCYKVHNFIGTPTMQEEQENIKYQAINDIYQLKFPKANYKIIEKLCGELNHLG